MESQSTTSLQFQVTSEINYGGFWHRLGAKILDYLILTPVWGTVAWCSTHYKYSLPILALPSFAAYVWYYVINQAKYGATPGKKFFNLKVQKINGSSFDLRSAWVRYSVEFAIGVIGFIGTTVATLRLTDEQFALGAMARAEAWTKVAPWVTWLNYPSIIWSIVTALVILVNLKKRATHDFIAGTVVIYSPKNKPA